MKNTLIAFAILLAALVPAQAIPPQMTPKSKVSGTVVDYERASGLLALKDAQGVDTKLKKALMLTERTKTQQWLKNLDDSYLVIEIKKEDMKGIRKRVNITITDYQYGVDSGFLIVSYSSLKVDQ